MDKAKQIVINYVNLHKNILYKPITKDDVYIVWFCKTLQNFKVLLSTTLPDGMYYEVTFDGDKNKYYLDVYKKWKNISIKAESLKE